MAISFLGESFYAMAMVGSIFRALGPSLAQAGVNGLLPDPGLSVYNQSGSLVVHNDNWRTTQGAYTAVVTGAARTERCQSVILVIFWMMRGGFRVLISRG